MTAVDKLKQRAQKYLAAGKLEKAIDAYQFLAEHDSTNPRWPHKLGELHQDLSNEGDAVTNFERAAGLYAEQGFLLKGIALCRQILTMDNDHLCSQALLSDLVERRNPAPLPEVESIQMEKGSAETGLKEFSLENGQTLDSIQLADVLATEEQEALAASSVGSGIYTVEIDDDVADAALDILDAPSLDAQADQGGTGDLEGQKDDREDKEGGMSLVEKVQPTPLFGALAPDALALLVAELDLRFYKKGEVIIKEGAEGTSLFVLVEGEVVVYHEGPPRIDVSHLEDGAFFGEIALLTQRKRTATVETLTECTMLELSRETVGHLVTRYPSALKVMLRFFRARLVGTLVDTHPLFAPFGGGEREALAGRFSFVEVLRGRELAKEGERVDGLYVLLSGKLEGSTKTGASFELDTGDVFGETSLLSGRCAPFTVKSKARSWLLKLDNEIFREVIMTHPQVLKVVTGLVKRQLNAERQAPMV
ncbi:MAG: cyclic nucleotide-binding domain-containing protein [Deltaproteobacteria bacterium]|nr:cyclic nucleotide-binding domain-containing protein [Deltaproteobacteria bacterium]